MQTTLLIATSNPHKVDEIRAVLGPLGITCESLASLVQTIAEPEETETTFEANALLKARWYAQQSGRVALADDSGLEVDALDGAPGIYSARYAGVGETRQARDEANNSKLLTALAAVADAQRTARFVCALSIATPDGAELASARGTFEGVIGHAARGTHGFGYDPLLVLEDGRTSAELSSDEKNARSHRGAALRALAQTLSTTRMPDSIAPA
ncbi:MAG: RdgB/HAM1 family non-canonical purine NTP pyrophosphatase [Phycisphaerales bacterium]|nr:RdgB/HAM1 family non-canonical purine NTP pyrophosphatase [Phycisphaerales bacterium]